MKLKYIQLKGFISRPNMSLAGQNEDVDMEILHNIIVYPKVKIYSSRSSDNNFHLIITLMIIFCICIICLFIYN